MPRPPVSKKPPAAASADQLDGPLRLQKILAAAGLGSRRQCEELILTGRVEVDRKVVTELGSKADPATQEIRVDGVNLPRPKLVYFIVNKPTGVLSTNSDPSGRPRVIDLVPYPGRLFAIGRLDMSSEGMILVTNDGELADRLTHPRYGVEKTYQVEVAGSLERHELEKLCKGVHLAEGFAKAVSAKVLRSYKQSTLVEIVLAEGRNREIRRILARVGHKVERLRRVAIGPLRMAELPVGHSRPLERDEIKQLKRAARGLQTDRKPPAKRKPRKVFVPAAKSGPAPRTVIGAETSGKRPHVIGGDQPRAVSAAGGKPRGATGSGRPMGAGAKGKPRGARPGATGGGRPMGAGAKGKPRGAKPGTPSGGKSFGTGAKGKPRGAKPGTSAGGGKPRPGGGKSRGATGAGRPKRSGRPSGPKRGN
jgi:23S rRNA pseudouridine2605 synthase